MAKAAGVLCKVSYWEPWSFYHMSDTGGLFLSSMSLSISRHCDWSLGHEKLWQILCGVLQKAEEVGHSPHSPFPTERNFCLGINMPAWEMR